MPVVSNSSPLIALTRIQRLDLVPGLLGSVQIPPAVVSEIKRSIPVLPDWMLVRAPAGPLASPIPERGRLGDGEWEAIAPALETGSAILLDDRPARRLAEPAGINAIGTLGLLLEAKRARIITAVRPELDKLLETSFFLGRQLYNQVLRKAGELES